MMKRILNKKNVAITTFLLLQLSSAMAQQNTKPLKLQDAVAASISNNKNVQLSQLEEKIAASQYQQTQAIYLPQISLNYIAFNSNNPLNAFGFKLQQRSVSMNDFNPDVLNHPNGTSDFTTKLELQQPIVNMDLWYQRKAAAKQTEIYKFKTQRTKEYLTYNVQKAYLQLQLSYKAVSVLEEALQTTKAVHQSASNYFNQGLIQKSDVLNAQVYVTTVEKDLAIAKSNIQTASDYLSNLMGNKLSVVYTIDSTENFNNNDTSFATQINATRADFTAMQKAIDAANLLITSQQKSFLPKLNAFGNYQLNDNRMLGFGANSYLVGMQLSWNIFKGNATKNAIATQTLERNKLNEELNKQKDDAQLELNKTNRELQDGLFAIKQYQAAVEHASEALRILQNRYKQGLINTTDVLMATSQVSQQKFALAQAIFNTNVTRAYLQFITSK